jgi:hypothetical protein
MVSLLSLGARAGAGEIAPADSVTTREGALSAGGVSYQQIEFEGRDYFMKSPRPGSALTEVLCAKPASATAPALSVASRSRAFVDALVQGCAAKAGAQASPERFTFEQRPARENKTAHQAAPGQQKVELLGPSNFPPDVDPHILPGQPPAGGNFDWNEKRY